MYSEKVSFKGSLGQTISGRLEHPVGRFGGWAIFAHCFTCSKQSRAAVALSRALAQHGIGVLRFDFTGIGESEGEFADTDFSSNVADIHTAAVWMAGQGRPVSLLVGHSLGGTASIVAASGIETLKALVSIAAPSEAAHVISQFGDGGEQAEADGSAEVKLGGRPFTITRELIEDLREARVGQAISSLRLPILLLHAPGDQEVSVDHATALFMAARHPKSFVSLDDATHFLDRDEDTDFAASVIAGWAERYMEPDADEREDFRGDGVLVRETQGPGPYQNEVLSRGFRQIIDEPRKLGGSDTGPDPYSMLSAALGGCTSITLRMYADRKGWPVDHIGVAVAHTREHAEDCTDCGEADKIDTFTRTVSIEGDVNEDQIARLLEIADKCPVHRTLESGSRVRSSIEHTSGPSKVSGNPKNSSLTDV